MNQQYFQFPVTKFGKTPPEFVGNLNVTYDGRTGHIIWVTWGEGVIRTQIHDLLQAVAPDCWDEIVAAKNAHIEAQAGPDEEIEIENETELTN